VKTTQTGENNTHRRKLHSQVKTTQTDENYTNR